MCHATITTLYTKDLINVSIESTLDPKFGFDLQQSLAIVLSRSSRPLCTISEISNPFNFHKEGHMNILPSCSFSESSDASCLTGGDILRSRRRGTYMAVIMFQIGDALHQSRPHGCDNVTNR